MGSRAARDSRLESLGHKEGIGSVACIWPGPGSTISRRPSGSSRTRTWNYLVSGAGGAVLGAIVDECRPKSPTTEYAVIEAEKVDALGKPS